MEIKSTNIRGLRPEQRKAAEKLLGRSLVDFQKVMVKVFEDGNDIVVRFFGGKQRNASERPQGDWDVPSCFNVLTDMTDDEQADYDLVVTEPVKLSRPL